MRALNPTPNRGTLRVRFCKHFSFQVNRAWGGGEETNSLTTDYNYHSQYILKSKVNTLYSFAYITLFKEMRSCCGYVLFSDCLPANGLILVFYINKQTGKWHDKLQRVKSVLL